MLPLAAELQKVPKLAYYSVKLMSNSMLNGEETIEKNTSVKICHLKVIHMILWV